MKSGIGFDKPQSFPFLALAARLSTRTRAFDVLPDGRFTGLVSGAVTLTPNSEMRIVLNWFQDLKRLAPVN